MTGKQGASHGRRPDRWNIEALLRSVFRSEDVTVDDINDGCQAVPFPRK